MNSNLFIYEMNLKLSIYVTLFNMHKNMIHDYFY